MEKQWNKLDFIMARSTYNNMFLLILCSLLLMVGGYGSNEEQVEEEEASVQDLPDFLSANETIHVSLGSTLKQVCQVNQMTPNVNLIWSVKKMEANNNMVLTIGNTRVTGNARMSFQLLTSSSEGMVMTIKDFSHEDAGLYECKVAAPNGKSVYFDIKVGSDKEALASSDGSVVTCCHSASAFWIVLALFSHLIMIWLLF